MQQPQDNTHPATSQEGQYQTHLICSVGEFAKQFGDDFATYERIASALDRLALRGVIERCHIEGDTFVFRMGKRS